MIVIHESDNNTTRFEGPLSDQVTELAAKYSTTEGFVLATAFKLFQQIDELNLDVGDSVRLDQTVGSMIDYWGDEE